MQLRYTILILLTCMGLEGLAQSVSGFVRDAESREPIPFASVWIKGTTQGIMSGNDGHFEIASPKDRILCVSSVGYNTKETTIVISKNQEVTIFLNKDVQNIKGVTVKPKVPIAKRIFKNIQKNKKRNRQQIRGFSDYKKVANTTVYVAIDTTSGVTRIFDDINEVTMELDNQKLRFSPIYLYEEAINVEDGKDTLVFDKKDGIFPRINQAIETYILQNVVVDLDFYKDQIFIMDRGFVSPISNNAMMYYKLYFNDSTTVDGRKYYDLSFVPKNKYNSLFSGHFKVDAESYALKELDAYISKEANLNFINGFKAHVRFQPLDDGRWFYSSQNVGINMSLTLNKDTAEHYNSQRFDQVASGNWLISKTTRYSTSKELDKIEASEWTNQTEFESSQLADETYGRVDKLKENKYVKAVDAIGGMALSSYLNAGKIDIGPVFDIYSTNTIEGNRITVPLRTSEKWNPYFSVGGFIGYGTKNKGFKYGGNIGWQPQETDKFVIRLRYSDDYNLVSTDKYLRFIKNNPNNKGNSNFIASFTTRERNPYLKEEQSVELRLDYNAPNDVHVEATPYFSKITNTEAVRFTNQGIEYNSYKNYGVLMNVRLPFGQEYDKYFFDRVYYLTPVPVVNIGMDVGSTSVSGFDGSKPGWYTKVHGSIQGRLIFGQVFMNYMLNGGYLVGDAPYDMLDFPVGSMSLGYAKYRFNLLHHASFAHNLYTNTHLHFNCGGIVLNRIPLIKKLKLREVVSFKGHYGERTSSYKGIFDLPDFASNEMTRPYGELGLGLTNIFKVLRVEYVRLLGSTYKNSDFTDRNGIFFRAEMSF